MAYNSGKRQTFDESGKPKGMGDIKKNPKPLDPRPVQPNGENKYLANKALDKMRADIEAKKAAEAAKKAAEKAEADRIAQAEKDKLAAEQRKKDEEAALALKNAGNETYTPDEQNTAIGRRKQKMIGEFGRSDTILTGPLGIPQGPASRAKKTLLGV